MCPSDPAETLDLILRKANQLWQAKGELEEARTNVQLCLQHVQALQSELDRLVYVEQMRKARE